MEANRKVSPRMDALDAERFQQMIESDLFKAMWARILAEMRRSQETCESSDSNLDVLRAQGAVRFGKMVLTLPEMLLAEMKSGPRYTNPHPIAGKPSNLSL